MFELVDKRVDKIILNNGYLKSEIFYSPINVLFTFWVMLFATLLPAAITALYYYFSKFSLQNGMLYIFIYLLVSYLLIAMFNRSFAITEHDFLVINSHFPFSSIQNFKFEDINEVLISSDWKLKPLMIFGLFYHNYVQVKIRNQEKRFYCLFLDVDCYDENWTERTLDDLVSSLKAKNISVKIDI